MRRAVFCVAMAVVCSSGLALAAHDGELPLRMSDQRITPTPADEQWTDAEARLIRAVQEAMQAGSVPVQLRAIHNLAYRYWERGDYQEAIALYKEGLSIAQKAIGPESLEAVVCYNNLGMLYREQGSLDPARKMHSEALRILAKEPDVDLLSDTYFGLGLVSLSAADYRDAEKQFDRARSSVESRRKGSMEHARLMDCYARLYILMGRLGDANRAAQKAWTIADKLLAAGSMERVAFLDTKASIAFGQRKFTEAERTWEQAIDISEKVGRAGSPDMISVYSHLGTLHTYTKDPQRAAEYLERALTLMQGLAGSSSADAAMVNGELGQLYTRTGDMERAKQKLDAARSILDTPSATHRSELAVFLIEDAEYLGARGDWRAAYQQVKRAVELREQVLGEHPLVVTALRLCADAAKKAKAKGDARAFERRANEMAARLPQFDTSNAIVDVKALRADASSSFTHR